MWSEGIERCKESRKREETKRKNRKRKKKRKEITFLTTKLRQKCINTNIT
jgi:hypothetical protein